MITQRTSLHLLIMVLICLASWTGLALQFITLTRNLLAQGKSILEATVQFISYFTVTTNTLIAITTTLALLFPQTDVGRWCQKPATITAIAVYIAVVGLVYNIVLRPLSHLQGIDKLGNELVHSLVPLLYVWYWLLYATKGNVNWMSSFYWLIYPFLYLVYTFVHGRLANWYPYPFMNASVIGYQKFWLNCFYLLIVFVLLNLIFIRIDKWIAKSKSTGQKSFV